MPRENRTPVTELERRYALIQDMIAAGLSAAKIVKYCQQEFDSWGVSERQLYNYVNTAHERLADLSNVDRREYFGLVLKRNEWLYSRALADSDFRLARQINVDLVDLLDLSNPSADWNWESDAEAAGLDSEGIKERVKRLVMDNDDLMQEAADGNG